MASATALHNELKQAVAAGDNATSTALLSKLKIELSELGLLFPTLDSSTKPDVGALTAARDILEIGAFQSIRSQDIPAFERYLSLLSTYYNDLSSVLSKSSNEAPLLSLSLLRLLSQNRIAEFHTLLETLPPAIVDSSEVSWVTNLEQCLMEGSYSRVWQLCNPTGSSVSLPRPEFGFFVSGLVETVRGEIASCDERAYSTLPLADAKTLLFFTNEAEVRTFAESRGWHIDSKSIVHFPASPLHPRNTASSKTGIPSSVTSGSSGPLLDNKELNKETVVSAALAYARELESIV